MALFRRARAPGDIAALFGADERALAWADDVEGARVLASSHGLWVPGPAGPHRIRWDEIVKAGWRDGVLTLVCGHQVEPTYVDPLPPMSWHIPAAGGLPAAIRERVDRSVVVTAHHPLSGASGGVGVRIVARKVPGADGLSWRAHLDPGVTRTDPGVRDLVAELIARAKVEQTARAL